MHPAAKAISIYTSKK